LQSRRQEIDGFKMRVDKLAVVGHKLMQSSSRVRASDIESRLARLSELWSQLDHKAKTR